MRCARRGTGRARSLRGEGRSVAGVAETALPRAGARVARDRAGGHEAEEVAACAAAVANVDAAGVAGRTVCAREDVGAHGSPKVGRDWAVAVRARRERTVALTREGIVGERFGSGTAKWTVLSARKGS